MTFKIEVTEAEGKRLLDWLINRGGVTIWEVADLSRAGERTFVPADADCPGWQYADKPVEVITDRADIGVYTEYLFDAFPVGLKSNGMTLKLTDAAQRRVNKVMTACTAKHGNAHYRKGALPDKVASIGVYYASEAVPL